MSNLLKFKATILSDRVCEDGYQFPITILREMVDELGGAVIFPTFTERVPIGMVRNAWLARSLLRCQGVIELDNVPEGAQDMLLTAEVYLIPFGNGKTKNSNGVKKVKSHRLSGLFLDDSPSCQDSRFEYVVDLKT